MSRVSVTLTDEVTEKLQQLANVAGKSILGIASKMVDLRLKLHEMQNRPDDPMKEKLQELISKAPANILCILAITSEILFIKRCGRDDHCGVKCYG